MLILEQTLAVLASAGIYPNRLKDTPTTSILHCVQCNAMHCCKEAGLYVLLDLDLGIPHYQLWRWNKLQRDTCEFFTFCCCLPRGNRTWSRNDLSLENVYLVGYVSGCDQRIGDYLTAFLWKLKYLIC